jgi:opacity protein-like surface antigen
MHMHTFKLFVAAAAAAVIVAPAPARADAYVSPWAAVQFGGKLVNLTNLGSDIDRGRAGFGVTAGGMGAGIFGAEFTFGYSPSFFGTNNDFGNNSVIDVMGNLIIGIPIGGSHGGSVRPFFTGGAGLLRSQIDPGGPFNVEASNNDAGWNVGGGVMGFFNDHFGLRGEVRYNRAFSSNTIAGTNLGTLNFTRLSIGVVFR